MARIAELQSAFNAPAAQPSNNSTAAASTAFAGALHSATAAQASGGLAAVPSTGSGVGDEHIGIVEGVRPDGSIQTIEGNSYDRVSRRVHRPGDALGFVHLR